MALQGQSRMAELIFNYGVMGSGKTSSLLQTKYNYEKKNLRTLLIKPRIDTKGTTEVISRIGLHCQVDILLDAEDVIMKRVGIEKPSIILVDEAQFLTRKQIDELFLISKMYDILVECYGLRTDFQTEGFEGSDRLLQIADELHENTTICSCGDKAIINMRLINNEPTFDGEQVMIENEQDIKYEGVCGKCYIKKRGKIR